MISNITSPPQEDSNKENKSNQVVLDIHKKLILIYGYIREIESVQKLFGVVPDEIKKLIHSFGKYCDQWDIERSNNSFEYSNDQTTIILNKIKKDDKGSYNQYSSHNYQ